MKIIATIEARMDSSRLPGKILKDILGRPMLELLVERVRRSQFIQDVVVATTVAPNDETTVKACEKMRVKCFRGSSEDVLDRVLKAAQAHQADLLVELTGDCPLIDPVIIDSVIQHFLENNYDYVSNVLERTFPRGMDTQIFPVRVLEEVDRLTQAPADRENVSLYIYEHPERYRLGNVAALGELHRPDLRLTVDMPEDYALIKAIYENLYPKNPRFLLGDVIRLLEENPGLKAMNAHVRQKKVR